MGKRRPAREPTNEERVEGIEDMLQHFSEYSRFDKECSIIDLMTDLRHWCAANGVNFDDTVRISADHYQTETRAETSPVTS